MTTQATPATPSLAVPVSATPPTVPATALIILPGLRNAAPVGGGCCAVAADDAVREELESLPGVTVEKIDPGTETVTVRLDPDRADRLSDAVDAVRDLGFRTLASAAADRSPDSFRPGPSS